VIVTELAGRYAARTGGTAEPLSPALPFSRYAEQQAEHPDEAAVSYWLAQCKDSPPALALPTDRPRTMQRSYRGATWTGTVDPALTAAIRKSGARLGCTMFVTLLGAFKALMGRLADAEDVVVAVPAAGQSAVADQVLVGHCVNLLPIRTRWTADTVMSGLLRDLRQTVLDAYEHQACTLGTIVRRLDLPREPGRLPLTEVQFNLERLADVADMNGVSVSLTPNPKQYVVFDLFMNIVEAPNGLRIDLDYNTDLFDRATIARWMDHLRTILSAIATAPDQQVRRLPLLSEQEQAAVLVAFNDTATPLPDQAVNDLVAAQAARTPDAIAIRCGSSALTYHAMNQRANQLANRLRREATESTARVGILLGRSVDLPIALLAVMRAGFAYVPMDPTHPVERLRTIIRESGATLLLADSDEAAAIATTDVNVVRLDESHFETEPEVIASDTHDPNRPAYVIYTSGSTGTPKGVEVGHRAMVNLLLSMAKAPGCSVSDRLLAVTTVAFDIAGLELFLPLIVGAEVALATTAEATDGAALTRLVSERGITMMQATPSLWRIVLEAGFRAPPEMKILSGGEPLDRALANRLLEGEGPVWNLYGPTETTIWSSAERVMPGTDPIAIGRPIANTQFYILDNNLEPRPTGVTGMLYIGGTGLANGYVNQPTLTDAGFPTVAVAGAPPRRMYRTGDLARMMPDGRVRILGRTDTQVKLHGFRIELGEIEAAAARVNGVVAAAVRLQPEIGSGQLVGYYVAAPDSSLAPAQLIQALSATLPDYMVPTLWMRLDTMPMTPNGKVDSKALPLPEALSLVTPLGDAPPRTAMERLLAQIWREVLEIDTVGVTDNLFALGADSIHMFRIAARMIHEGLGLSARDLLRHPTIADLAEAAKTITKPKSNAPSLAEFIRAKRAQPAV
jgi:amino acid adenylation domain-containing protein